MSRLFVVLSLLITSTAFANSGASAFNLEEAKERCLTHFTESPEIYANDYHWGYTLLEMEDRFEEIYSSGKRLNMHSEYLPEKNQFVVYYDDKKHFPVVINDQFIKSVTNQIEVAIENGFADFVFFPDMGHSHLYFPQDHWDKEYLNFEYDYKTQYLLYQKMINDPKMKALYHLTEQLQMLDENDKVMEDPILSFKYWHRNFVGYNDGSRKFQIELAPEDKKYNTVSGMEGHKSWSAGFAVSASKDGCFPYTDKDGKVRYFDIGLQDPRYDPAKTSEESNL